MTKIPFSELRIRIFTPLDPRDPCLALIGNGPVLFKGSTPIKVKQAAEEWRRAELDKLAKKAKPKKETAE